jgi:hypothetical protein
MIVRCNNCVSAFAVDDEKVANKKFAFTCPKCSSENIIDNRVIDSTMEGKGLELEESFFNDDFSIDTESPIQEKEKNAVPEPHEEDIFFDDELASEFPSEDTAAETGRKDRKLNLEIEESADFSGFDDEDILSEKTPAEKQQKEDELFAEVPAFEAEDEFISFDDEAPAKASADEFGIELKEDSTKPEEDEIFFDDFDETPSSEKKPDKEADLLNEETDFEFEDIEIKSDETKGERDEKLSSQDDIDALFAEEGIEFDEKPISKQSEIDFEDEITVDLDQLDIDLEESGEDKPFKQDAESVKTENSLSDDITLDIDNLDIDLEETPMDADLFEEPAPAKPKAKAAADDEDITLDIDSLDIDLEETPMDTDLFEEPAPAKQKTKAASADEDITLDIDSLDIDLEEASMDTDLFEEPAPAKQKTKATASDDDITLDIDNLDIDLEEAPMDIDLFEEPAPAKQKTKTAAADEDITLDIDSLDIDLEEAPMDADLFEEPAPAKMSKSAVKKEIISDDDFNEEDIKLNLDDLDIDLAEIEERELIFEDDIAEQPVPAPRKKSKPLIEEPEEDESITIDLDTLEIEIAEESRPGETELSEEDEKLTLDDAGLTFDELTSEVERSEFEESSDEDLKLTLDEIDPDLTLDKIAGSGRLESERVYDTLDELPEIDLDEYDAIVRQEESTASGKSFDDFEDDFIVFPETESEHGAVRKPEYDMFDYDESDREKSPEKGSTFFSIDLSLKYSRLGALLRLLGLYMLSMIPHLIVVLIYTALSSILGFINQIVILSTGRCVEDFALIIENTLRYFLYIDTNIIGIVEDRPVYAGRESIDHPLQLNITYPLKYSKNLAILRLSIIGIMLITLPHLIIMSLIAITIPLVYLIGIIIVLITRRWPNILFIYLTKFYRYFAKISSFMTGLTDEYPPFTFD